MMNSPEYTDLERQIAEELQKTPLAVTPDPAVVQQIDQELPEEWTQLLEREQEYTPEELSQLLSTDLDIPEGDINQNAYNALNELYQDGALNHEEIMQEVHDAPEVVPELEIPHEQDLDFDR